MFVRVFRVANFVRLGRLNSGDFLYFVFYRAFHFLRPVGGLLCYLYVRSTCFPGLLYRLPIFFCRAAIRSVEGQYFVFQVFRRTVRAFHLFLHRSVVVIADENRRGVFTVHLICPLQRGHQIRGRQRRLYAGLVNDLPFLRQGRLNVRARRNLFRRFL